MRIIISCMDRRLNRYLDQWNDGNTVFVRNAGSNVGSLRDTLKLLKGADEIVVLPHTDCGAMGVVHKALSGEKMPDVLNPLITPFLNLRGKGREELERENLEVQLRSLRSLVNAKVRGEIIHKEKLGVPPSAENVALVTAPSKRKYSEFLHDVDRTFVIQVEGGDSEIDVYIAKEFLKVKEVKYLK